MNYEKGNEFFFYQPFSMPNMYLQMHGINPFSGDKYYGNNIAGQRIDFRMARTPRTADRIRDIAKDRTVIGLIGKDRQSHPRAIVSLQNPDNGTSLLVPDIPRFDDLNDDTVLRFRKCRGSNDIAEIFSTWHRESLEKKPLVLCCNASLAKKLHIV